MSGEARDGETHASAYTRPPERRRERPRTRTAESAAYIAAAVVFAVLAFRFRPAPAPPVEDASAAAAAPAALAAPREIAPPAPVRAEAPVPRYVGYGLQSGTRPKEPEEISAPGATTWTSGGVYDPVQDGYPVAGGFIDVVVDGRAATLPLKPALSPGARKLFVELPRDGLPHSIEFRPVYDLGADGLVRVSEKTITDGKGHGYMIVTTPVETVVIRAGDAGRRVRVK